jgi:hypothetical protein
MAFDLVAAFADSVDPFYQKGISPAVVGINQAPQQITLRFSAGVRVDPATLIGNVQVVSTTGGGLIDVGLSVDEVPNENQVVVRFKETLRDGSYQINVGSGLRSLATSDTAVATTVNVRVDLGAFVVGVVPQPVERAASGGLTQALGQIHVFFNTEDPLNTASAQEPSFYRLYAVNEATNGDEARGTIPSSGVRPSSVTYDPVMGRALLRFGSNLSSADGLYRLEIGGRQSQLPIVFPAGSDENSSFTTALNLNTLDARGATIQAAIDVRQRLPTPVGNLEFPSPPGALDTPGHRDVPVDSGDHGVPPFAIVDPVSGITSVAYNFRPIIGADPQGNLLQNVITEAQKQRAREVFEVFSLHSGVRFVETPDQGLMVATGDLRAFDPTASSGTILGLGGGSGALMNSLVNWGDSEYGGSWFQTAMHEIGHALGLLHTYDLPSIMGAGVGSEPIFPGDYDFEHLRQLYPASGSDIDVYRFNLNSRGSFSVETVVARPGMPVTSHLDTVISLYRESVDDRGRTIRTLVARNDDFYGRDSFVGLDLDAGTYFVAVTSAGNTAFDPNISDSGANGRTGGEYRLELRFNPAHDRAQPLTIVDLSGNPIDGDRDGHAGGAFKYWFRVAPEANTIYVNKVISGAAETGAGTRTNPFKTISAALAAVNAASNDSNPANDFRIIRIAGAASTPYEIGTDLAGGALRDGQTFNVPAGVTVMMDGGATFKLRSANIDVGSSSPLVSRANAAIQVLGIPATRTFAGRPVTFTSWHDDTIGGDSDGVGTAVQGGQWGGIVLRQDSDVASKRAFVNSISGAEIRYGGGQVRVDSDIKSFAPIQIESTRPTVLFNTIVNSAGAGIAATPNSFEDTGDRVGPEFRGNRLTDNSVNGLFIKIDTRFGTPIDRLDVPARFKSTDIVYVIQENLLINGGAGGYASTTSRLGNIRQGVFQVTGLAQTSDLRVGMQVEIRDPADPDVSALPPGFATIRSIDSPTAVTLSAAPIVSRDFATVTFRTVPVVVERTANLALDSNVLSGVNTAGLAVGMQVVVVDPSNEGTPALSTGFGVTTIVSIPGNSSVTLSAVAVRSLTGARVSFIAPEPARVERNGNLTISSNQITGVTTTGLRVGMRVEIVNPANPGVAVLTDGVSPVSFATVTAIVGGTVTLDCSATATVTSARVSFIEQAAPLGFARQSGRLAIDPGVVVKLFDSRIELERGLAQLVAEGSPGKSVIFTSLGDNRFGAGGTFDTNGSVPDKFDAVGRPVGALTYGDWGGIVINAGAEASIDRSYIAFGGGETPIEGGFDNFNVLEVHQGDLRLANSRVEFNASGLARTSRIGRGGNGEATVFVRGSQPIIVGNDFRSNLGAAISVNANALSDIRRGDSGRSTGASERYGSFDDNFGPLVRGNRLAYQPGGSAIAGMVVRGQEITVESVWDDIDIVHVVRDEIIVQNFHTATGLRLLSKPDASLVVKLQGQTAGFTAAGEHLDIEDRIGGTVQVIGQPGYPVILASLRDDSVGASLDPLGLIVKDTNVDGGASVAAPGDWRSLRFLPSSNDRNVTILLERETAHTSRIDVNNSIDRAEPLGVLAPNFATANNSWESSQEKSGDENRRLGFEVHGNVALDDPNDVDLYSFMGVAGSEVWVDIDKTTPALDVMVELLDAAGVVRARSVDGVAEGGVEQGEVVVGVPGVLPGTPPVAMATYQFAPAGLAPGAFSMVPGTLRGVLYDGPFEVQTFSVDPNGVISFQNILGRDRLGEVNGIPVPFGSDSYATGGTVDLANGRLTLTFSGAGMLASQVEVRYSYQTPVLTAVTGVGQTLGKDAWRGGDYFSQSPRDAGMRLILPGVQGTGTRYYIRVRSQPRYEPVATGADNGNVAATTAAQYRADVADPARVGSGATSGRYELRVRLRQRDEKPGSTVRFADIRNATIGIDVQGLPTNSHLLANTGEHPSDTDTTDTNGSLTTAQEIGNVLESNRGALSVAGAIAAEGDVDWYTFTLDYDKVQPGSGPYSWATMFDIDYADGFRGDLTISVFSSTGTLIYVGRDSDVTDDQPGINQGSDFDDLSKGSLGKLDPMVGTINLAAGGPGSTSRYYVAISSNERLPAELNGTLRTSATNTVVRLEPISAIDRVVTDRIGALVPAEERLINTAALGTNVTPFTLADVTMFVTDGSLRTVDAMRGGVETTVAGGYGDVGDMVMRTDGNLYVYAGVAGSGVTAGRLDLVDSGTGARTLVGNDGIPNLRTITQTSIGSNEFGVARSTYTFTLGNRDIQPETFEADLRLFTAGDPDATPPIPDAGPGTWRLTGPNRPLALADVGPIFNLNIATVNAAGFPSPIAATVNALTGIVTVQWGVAFLAGDIDIRNVRYDLRQTVTTDSVDAVVWGRTGAAGSGQFGNLYYAVRDNAVQETSGGPFVTRSRLYRADPANGAAVDPADGQAVVVGGVRYGRVGYTYIRSAAGTPNVIRTVTGMAFRNNTLYGVDTAGNFFSIDPTTAVATVIANFPGVSFQGLTNGPQNLNGGALANVLFALDNTGNLRALSLTGVLQTVFDANNDGVVDPGTTVLAAGAGNTGLAFSPLDINLWHTTTRRGGDPGGGGLSMYFGLENGAQFGGTAAWQADLLSNPAIGNNYNLPGGAYGSLTTNPFSLVGYSYTDKPTLYFDYWLQSEEASGTPGNAAMRDSARVLASLNGGLTWELLATNNSMLSGRDAFDQELPNFPSVSQRISNYLVIENQHVQELYDTSNWRQARVDLGKFVGQSNIRLRFDFHTAGAFDATQVRDVNGDGINDVLNNFVNDTTGLYVTTPGIFNQTGDFGSPGRGQRNQFEGFYIDDIVIGFAERGEAVSGATEGATTFFDVGTPAPSATVAEQVLSGEYQLEIRRGTDGVVFAESFNTNDRLIAQRSNTTAFGPRLGDANILRDQGQFLIESNIVTNASEYGIRVDAGTREAGSNAPYPGVPRNLPTLNRQQLAAGVVVANNVVARAGLAGILFSGDPNVGGGNVPQAAVPFGRVVNNTIYGGESARGTGVQITENAGPTLVNNLFMNLAQGVTVDGSSNSRTVVITSAYRNTAGAAGVVERGAIQLEADPFVNPVRDNFYLAAGSRAIDSAQDSVQDRDEFVQVNSPIGIGASPIISPERDLYGQVRSDDPNVTNLSGVGNNVFKDRGAIDRVDFAKPFAQLANPLDGSPKDRQAAADQVWLWGPDSRGLTRFEIQLNDVGVGIDKSTVTGAAFSLTRNGGALVEGVDYLFRYLETTNRVVFEAISVFPQGHYQINLISRPSVNVPTPQTGLLTDLANNTLRPNRLDGTTVFVVRLIDWPSAPQNLVGVAGPGLVTLEWTLPADNGGMPVTDYRVQYSTDGLNWLPPTGLLVGGPGLSYVVTGLTNGTPYFFRVAAINEAGMGPAAQTGPVTPRIPAPQPIALAATPGNSQVALAWIAPTPVVAGETISGYLVESSSNGGGTWTTVAIVPGTSTTVTGLTNGVLYTFRVTAVTNLGLGLPATATATPFSFATAPTNLVGVPAPGQVTLQWQPPVSNGGAAVTDYRVQYSTDGASWLPPAGLLVGGPGLTYVVTGLTNGAPYFFRVAAINQAGVGPAAQIGPIAPRVPPAAPLSLAASPANSQVNLSWVAPLVPGETIIGYRVEYSDNGGGTWATFVTQVPGTSAAVTGLTNGVVYTFRVTTVTNLGPGLSALVVATPANVPSAPTGVVATASDAAVSVSWNSVTGSATGGSPITGHRVEWSSNNGLTWSGIEVGPTATAATITGLANNVSYMVRVAARNARGLGGFGVAATVVTPLPQASAPTRLSGRAGNGSVALVWTAPTLTGGLPIVDYRVQYSTNYAGNPATATWVDVADIVSAAVRTTVAVPNGQTYVFRVAAVTAAGVGRFSTPSVALTPFSSVALPTAPTGLTATSPVSRQAHLAWAPTPMNEGGPVVAYVLQYRLSGSTTWQSIRTTTPARVLTGLVSGRDYVFRVRAQNLAGLGAFSQDVMLRVS